MTTLTSAPEACDVIMLMVAPEGNVKEAGFNSDVLTANVAPTGTAAVAPVVSTHTSFGKYRNDTTQLACVVGTVMLVALLTVREAFHLLVDGIGA